MKKIFSFLMVVSLIPLLFSGCNQATKNENKTSSNQNQLDVRNVNNVNTPEFSIYLVKDTDYSKIDSNNLNEINLEKQPIISHEDIDFYDWNASTDNVNTISAWEPVKSKNFFKLKNNVNLKERIAMQGHKGTGFFGFVVTVGSDRIYSGAFSSQPTSMCLPKNIYVFSPLNPDEPQYIELLDISNKDLVHDKRVYNTIKSFAILNE